VPQKVDLHDEAAITKIVKEHEIDACIHLAGSKAVGERCIEYVYVYVFIHLTFLPPDKDILESIMRKNNEILQYICVKGF
jgi:dTDP-D-glucose 4,6-dehydratase